MSVRQPHVAGIAGGAVFFTITAIAQPFFSLYAQSLGASTATVGLLVTLRALVPMFIAMPVGQLIDVVGALTMARAGFVLLVASLAVTAATGNLFLLAVGQMVLGASIIVTASSLQVLASHGEEARRNRNINHYSVAMSGGGMVGPLLGGWLVAVAGGGGAGYRFAFAAATGVSLLATMALQLGFRKAGGLGAASRRREAAHEPMNARSVLRSYLSGLELARSRGVQFGLMGTFLIMFIQSMSFSFIPLFLSSAGFGTWMVSAMVSLNGLAGITSRLFLGRMIKWAGLERLLVAAGCVAAASLALLPLASIHAIVFGMAILLMGSAVGLNLPVSIMIMVNDSSESDRGKVMGLRLLSNRLAQMIGPALFGILGQVVGLAAAFHIGGGLLLAAVAGFGIATLGGPRSRGEARSPADDSPAA
jgi:predicted MFS family arabinose efflux permease